MNAKQLKDSVLQYALQGKLVTQDSNDEPVSELLKRIAVEKEHLIKERVIKKEKPSPSITDEEIPFDIPSSWEWARLQDVAFLSSGINANNIAIEKHAGDEDSVLYIKVSDMNHIENQEEILVSSSVIPERLVKNYLPLNSIIFPKRGGAILTNKKRKILKKKVVLDPNIMALTPFLDGIFFEYIYLWFGGIDFKNLISGTSVPQINNKDLYQLLIPLPPLAEQERIVRKFKDFLNKIAEYDVLDYEVKDLQMKFPSNIEKSVLQFAMQGKLVEQDSKDKPAQQLIEEMKSEKEQLIKDKVIKKENPLESIKEEIPFDIPSTWQWIRLGDISTKIHYGYTASAAEKGNAKLLRITDIQNNSVNWGDVPYCSIDENKLKSMLLKERDILIARTGGTIGKSFLIKEVKDCSVFASYLIRVQLLSQISEDFISYYLRSPLYWNQLIEMSAGTGQPNVNAQNLKLLLVPIPPLEEQYRIVTAIEQMLVLKNKLISID